MTEGRKPHFPRSTPACGQQRSSHSLQGGLADRRKAGAEAQEEAEGGCHDRRVGADQGGVQQGEDVKELVF